MRFRYWWPADLAAPDASVPPSPGFVILDDRENGDDPTRHHAWRLWLWLFNILQHLPGVFLATKSSLESGDYKTVAVSVSARQAAGAPGGSEQVAWDDVTARAVSELSDGLLALVARGVRPPDEVGFELAEDGDVVAEAELAWTANKLVLLMHQDAESPWSSRGWTTIIAAAGWPERIVEAMKLKG
jgi:DEAD/DEAH box helicase domain-containing protein